MYRPNLVQSSTTYSAARTTPVTSHGTGIPNRTPGDSAPAVASGSPNTGSRTERIRAPPTAIDNIARVTMNGETEKREITPPLITPMAIPTPTPAILASAVPAAMLFAYATRICPTTMLVRATKDPTDMSNPPVRRTTVGASVIITRYTDWVSTV